MLRALGTGVLGYWMALWSLHNTGLPAAIRRAGSTRLSYSECAPSDDHSRQNHRSHEPFFHFSIDAVLCHGFPLAIAFVSRGILARPTREREGIPPREALSGDSAPFCDLYNILLSFFRYPQILTKF